MSGMERAPTRGLDRRFRVGEAPGPPVGAGSSGDPGETPAATGSRDRLDGKRTANVTIVGSKAGSARGPLQTVIADTEAGGGSHIGRGAGAGWSCELPLLWTAAALGRVTCTFRRGLGESVMRAPKAGSLRDRHQNRNATKKGSPQKKAPEGAWRLNGLASSPRKERKGPGRKFSLFCGRPCGAPLRCLRPSRRLPPLW